MLDALLAGGFDACGFDVRGIDHPKISNDFRSFCQGLEVCFVVVRDAAQCDDLLFGAQNIAKHASDLNTVVICSTLSPKYLMGLQSRLPGYVALIDAPMSGAQIAAQEKRLSFMTGGDITQIQPMLETMGGSIHPMGAVGAGMQAKVLNNLLAATSTAMTRKVVDWANAAGLDEADFLNLVNASSGQNWLVSGWNTIEFAKDGWSLDNSIGILTKDIDAALDALPDGADTTLPKEVQKVIRALKPH
ncbi:NAD(P)-binding domain-containing protein [Nereida sp. MMG025]|uniref:NAD(P)-binding domain-containing protein n=1 Tax=Nereida sp. MMG025 TaxID=2909981 RepID=UPI001EFF70D3|nr:NAD(P)-binding domain-containing protein [Nereida sp. MMG025]MCF6444992.1 NAD-binding protein [Nereida sp. MMG025]